MDNHERVERVVSIVGATVTSGVTAASHALQSSEELRVGAENVIGKVNREMLQFHGGDMFYIASLGFLLGAFMTNVVNANDREKNVVAATMAVGGVITGIIFTMQELAAMLPTFVPVDCDKPMGQCRGDWGDVLAFAPMIIAGAVYLYRNREHVFG